MLRAGGGELLELRAPRSHQRELRGHEEAIHQHQHQHHAQLR
jgi:hypothetical protein